MELYAGETCFHKHCYAHQTKKRTIPLPTATANNIYKKNKRTTQRIVLCAVRTGLEPVTPCVTGMYSNQLN